MDHFAKSSILAVWQGSKYASVQRIAMWKFNCVLNSFALLRFVCVLFNHSQVWLIRRYLYINYTLVSIEIFSAQKDRYTRSSFL